MVEFKEMIENDEPEWEHLDDDEVFMIVAFVDEESLIMMWQGHFLHWCSTAECVTSLERLPIEYITDEPDWGVWAFEGRVKSDLPEWHEQIGLEYRLHGEWRRPTIEECRSFMEFEDDQ